VTALSPAFLPPTGNVVFFDNLPGVTAVLR
jgi:hypothetical protein